MLKLKIIWLTLLLIISFTSFAQQIGTLKGKVNSNEPLEGASISLKGTSRGAITNGNGEFSITNIPYDTYILTISAVSYKNLEKRITISQSLVELNDIKLKVASKSLEEVTIQGKTEGKKIKETGFNVNVIDTKQYANTNADINQILNRSTGIKIREQGGLGSKFSLSMNGLSGSHIKFFIDGVPIESFGSGMSLNNIPVNIAERIEVYKGVVPAHLGSDALGGAINIVTNRDHKRSLDASYSLGSFNTHRAAISTGYKNPKNGVILNFNSYYNYSNNDYLMKSNPKANVYLEVPSETVSGKFDTLRTARRFHNDYRSYMAQVEAGVADKKWADIAILGLNYNYTYDQQQTGATQEKVIGNVFSNSNSITPSFRYRKNKLFLERLAATVYANYSKSENVITDTSSWTYYFWNGKPDKYFPNSGELSSHKSIMHQKTDNSFSQLNLNYKVGLNHFLTFNYNLNTHRREDYNEIDPYNDFYNKTNQIIRTTAGLNYQHYLSNQRFNNSFFIKKYGLSGKSNDSEKNSKNYVGYGAVTNIKIWRTLGVKLSYEHAYQLPSFTQLFGDGLNVDGNVNLNPANSDNYNLNLYYSTTFGHHFLSLDASTFYRNAKDYIVTKTYESAAGPRIYSTNEGGIKINGGDFEIKYLYKSSLQAVLNMSYYNAVDRERYIIGTNREKITYGSRTPNEPWLFGNADISYGKNDVFGGKANRIQMNYYIQFVNNYSLSWSKLGDSSTKDYIPEQYIHNISLTYSLANNKYNITAEGRNITDQIAYDVFKQQKPGRSFYLKFRYYLHATN
ncbi:carboxypeptidase-like regulatory domain-containing protein [Sphingobacterium sp. SRCM116780]|uniref:TonB-dependent receptor n=1 Tax=Sphingobacterium sp. SRCM116780 TaxID=2907623 RepID=UPI001F398B95|nr:TonB-dependent receptor [Sphingobacterium sp. SRCM116780]UIR55512.1 carboxypeptidase-like regulatory domain-containing protein [Sphingobacterium sp. SRCM116780]